MPKEKQLKSYNMKKAFYNGTILLAILFTTSCGKTENKTQLSADNSSITTTTATVDTSGYFIKRILNCSPKEVAKYIGKPDNRLKPTNNCTYIKDNCTTTTYQNGKYKCYYYHNILKMFEIKGSFPFDDKSIILVGLPFSQPTFKSSDQIWWGNKREANEGPIYIKGIKSVNLSPDGEMIICVEKDFDKKF